MTAWKRDIQARAALECARTACAILPSKPSEGPLRTLLLPPARPGSLGDEAMMGVCMAELKRQGQGVGIVDFTEGDRWPDEPPGAEHVDLSAFFGRAYFRSLPGVIAVLRRYDRVWCLGADVMDGHYSPVAAFRRVTLLRLAAELGLDVTALGFSFNDEPSPLVVDALRTLPASVRLCARDPVSQARLIKHLGRPIDAVADLAFGLKPEPHPDDDESALLGWVAARHAEGDIILGLNVSLRAFQSTTGASVDEVVTAYASALSSLFRERSDVSVVAIPHDYRTSRSDTSDDVILRAIADRLEPRDRNRLRQPSFRLQARFVLR